LREWKLPFSIPQKSSSLSGFVAQPKDGVGRFHYQHDLPSGKEKTLDEIK